MILNLKLAVVCTSIVLVLVLLVPASAQRKNDLLAAPLSTAPYKVGERLTFNVSFSNIISAAHVEIRVVARGNFFGRDAIQLHGHVETTGVVNAALYALNNDYITYIDPETGLPFRSQLILREATRNSDTTVAFNEPASSGEPDPKARQDFPNVFDLVSAIYRLRATPLAEGSSYSFLIKTESSEYQAEVKVNGRQAVKTSVGSFNTIGCQLRIRNDPNANDFNIRLYFSDDERHLPVLVTAKHNAGQIKIELAGSDFVRPPAVAKPSPTPQPSNNAQPPSRSLASPQPQPPGAADSGPLDLPFKVGEQLNYQIFVANVSETAATATYHVRSRSRYFDHDGLLLSFQAQTTNALRRLFIANEQLTSYVDPKALLPFRSETNSLEGRRRLNQTLTINQDYGSAISEKGQKIEIPVGTHDFISFFYVLRTFNLTPPKHNAISLLVNNQPKTVFITSLKRETITLGSQSIPAIQVSITTDDPQPDKFQIRGWISDDVRRLPLRLIANTPIGPVRADLAIIPVVPQ